MTLVLVNMATAPDPLARSLGVKAFILGEHRKRIVKVDGRKCERCYKMPGNRIGQDYILAADAAIFGRPFRI
jgi:hypothetical protein